MWEQKLQKLSLKSRVALKDKKHLYYFPHKYYPSHLTALCYYFLKQENHVQYTVEFLLEDFSVPMLLGTLRIVTNTDGNRHSGRGKAIPLQPLTDPEGSRKLRRPDIKTIGT
jgi:hypothetical protein